MKLVQKTGCRYNEVMRNLRILENETIIIYSRLGRKCFVSLNRESPKARLLIKVIRILDTPIDYRQPCQGNERIDQKEGKIDNDFRSEYQNWRVPFVDPSNSTEVSLLKSSNKLNIYCSC